MLLSVATTAAALATPACGGSTDSNLDDAATEADAQSDGDTQRDAPVIVGIVIREDAGDGRTGPPILGLPPIPQDGGQG